ncbi:hypothetical protein [Paenibacillus sp.]|uniref:hypothetical protein n=1 Tax=Paenibacillus sp. TaxID=58172 RepID=UPI002D31A193|nr:hypothetical protein [Paenibacillus sp.]HZG88159.1 hypothetical protein [Paenibacillus sp.]
MNNSARGAAQARGAKVFGAVGIALTPKEQDEGAVVSEFSSTSRDECDIFTEPRIARIPVYKEDETKGDRRL